MANLKSIFAPEKIIAQTYNSEKKECEVWLNDGKIYILENMTDAEYSDFAENLTFHLTYKLIEYFEERMNVKNYDGGEIETIHYKDVSTFMFLMNPESKIFLFGLILKNSDFKYMKISTKKFVGENIIELMKIIKKYAKVNDFPDNWIEKKVYEWK